MDVSIPFYQSIGFSFKKCWSNCYAEITTPGIIIGLHPANENTLKGNSGNVSIGFAMDNVEETKSTLTHLSITAIERNEEGSKFLHFTDHDGHHYILLNQNGK